MSKSKPTDLPGTDLLFGSHAGSASVKEKAEEAIEKVIPEKQQSSGAMPIKMMPVESDEPVKFTFYFAPQLLEELEVAKFRLRMEKRLRVSKSDIVNAALQYALKDLNFLERLISGKLD